jgi:multiple sugar transport system substrate-binding protein
MKPMGEADTGQNKVARRAATEAPSGGLVAALFAAFLTTACGAKQADNEIVVQRFFGTCRAEYGQRVDVENANGECGIMTTLVNKFSREHPQYEVRVSPVAWPGYNQLAAQLAAGDPPDLVIMHISAISDYSSRGLLEPLDGGLKSVGVDPATFTTVSRRGVTKNGAIYGLPIDTWAPLWHINLNYFRKAGLMKDGEPVLPSSAEELIAQARQFKQATGKPYFIQSMVNERAAYARNLYTLLMQQNSGFFADPKHLNLRTPEAKRVVELWKQIYDEGLTTRNQDYAAATNGFMNGDGGVYIVGTWVIGDFDAESKKPNRPLSNGYTVKMFPQLYPGRSTTFADGHAWVMPTKERTPMQRQAIFALLKFFADEDFEWSRTGHLPAYQPVMQSVAFNRLPYRQNISALGTIGSALPPGVQRQYPVQEIIGEEMAAAIAGQKSVDAALADAESRVNDLLFHLL